jgi:hypothetical protein
MINGINVIRQSVLISIRPTGASAADQGVRPTIKPRCFFTL